MEEPSFSRRRWWREGVQSPRVERVGTDPWGVEGKVTSIECQVVSTDTASHLLLQTPTQDGELDSSSNWQLDPKELASKFTSRTKALILNTPSNPLGKVPDRPLSGDPSRLGSSTPSVTDLLPSGLSFFICEVGGLPVMSSEDRGSQRSQGQAQQSSGKNWWWIRLGTSITDFSTGQ